MHRSMVFDEPLQGVSGFTAFIRDPTAGQNELVPIPAKTTMAIPVPVAELVGTFVEVMLYGTSISSLLARWTLNGPQEDTS